MNKSMTLQIITTVIRTKLSAPALAVALTMFVLAGTGSAQNGGWGSSPTPSNSGGNSPSSDSSYGERIPFRNGELYFTAKVTQRQAESLVKWLDEMYGELENFKSYQLDKDGNELVVRSVVNDSAWSTNDLNYSFDAVEFLLQTQVFADSEVRLELTDDTFQTKKTFNKLGINPFGKRIVFNKNELFYTKDVTRQEADDFIEYMMKTGGSNSEVSFQLDRDGDVLIVRMVGNSDALNTNKFDENFDAMEAELQTMVFTNVNVRFEVTNFMFEPAKMIDKIPASRGKAIS